MLHEALHDGWEEMNTTRFLGGEGSEKASFGIAFPRVLYYRFMSRCLIGYDCFLKVLALGNENNFKTSGKHMIA
jgi:hypothetical protein